MNRPDHSGLLGHNFGTGSVGRAKACPQLRTRKKFWFQKFLANYLMRLHIISFSFSQASSCSKVCAIDIVHGWIVFNYPKLYSCQKFNCKQHDETINCKAWDVNWERWSIWNTCCIGEYLLPRSPHSQVECYWSICLTHVLSLITSQRHWSFLVILRCEIQGDFFNWPPLKS